VNHHKHIRSLLLPWVELRLNAHDQQLVEEHLKLCSSCKTYFEELSVALLPLQEGPKDKLVVDPFLPTRIKALVESSKKRRGLREAVVQWTMMSAMFVVAVLCGIFLGEKLSTKTSTVTDQNVITEYSDSIQGVGIADRLQSIAQSATEVPK
jgi:predicted anti-sigma-YlaC factor YlaD